MKALPNDKMRDATAAFHWIVGLLREQDIPFVIVGGLAARAYGVTRQLNDIDIDIPDETFPLIEPLVMDHLTEGPEHYKDEKFDLLQMSLKYKGQDIELTGADSCRLCDSRTGQWLVHPTDIEAMSRLFR